MAKKKRKKKSETPIPVQIPVETPQTKKSFFQSLIDNFKSLFKSRRVNND